MTKSGLRALTFLAPNMLPVYRFTMNYLGRKLGCEIELAVGTDYDTIYQADLAFICGLPYVLHTAPYLADAPYGSKTNLRGNVG
jgi:ABC-type phosphate/phosphonate transport system substrate-binding protein